MPAIKKRQAIKKRYLVDEMNRRVGVVLDLQTFKKMEEIVEDYLFGKILEAAAKETPISLEESKRRYARMKKRA